MGISILRLEHFLDPLNALLMLLGPLLYLLIIVDHQILEPHLALLYMLEHLIFILFITGMECCNDVLDLPGVAQCIAHQVPVVDHEPKVVLHFYLVSYFVSLRESVTHDGDQHVQHVDQKNELGEDVQEEQVRLLGA